MPGSANDLLFKENFFVSQNSTVQKWHREIESKTRSGMSPDGIIASVKLNRNVMNNYSNNATVDSIDGGSNATIRVYGPGGPGTTWHQNIGKTLSAELPAFQGGASYNTQYFVYYDGLAYHISSQALDTYPDGLYFAGSVLTVGSGGGGGATGGGGPRYSGGGSAR
jgi:hypothetical protein